MAGGNKSHSPKVKKRQIQEQAKATKDAADKRNRRTAYSGGSPTVVTSNTGSKSEMTRSQSEAYSGHVRSLSSRE